MIDRTLAHVVLSMPFLLAILSLTACTHPPKQSQTNHYINPSTCTQCHAAIAQTYQHTGMARSFYPPTAEDFPNPKPYFHRASNTFFQMIFKNGAWYQRSWQTGYNGKDDNVQELQVDSIMGSGNHVRTYLHRTVRNTLIELPLAWYVEKAGTWALNPGFDNPHPPVSRKIGYDCMFCHNSYPNIPPDHNDAGAEPVFDPNLPSGIDCQRCHGPGENHVRAARQSVPRLENIKSSIYNPKLNSIQTCMQCHLETTSAPLPNAIRRFDRGPYSYRPGEPLSAYVLFFDHAPGQGRDDKFEIVSSVYRLRKSRCFLESKGALTCTTCHNPHDIPHGPAAAGRYNAACGQCHATIAFAGHPSNPNCVGCHMPKRRTEDVVHAVMTDHLIQRRPAANLLAELPERQENNVEYRGEVVPYGQGADLYTAIAQVAQKSNLTAGIPRLESAISNTTFAEPYLELGDAYTNTGQYAKAIDPYRQALSRRPNSALILRRLANAQRGSRQPQQALESLNHAVQVDPNNAEAWYDLGLLQSDQNQKTQAIASLQKACTLDPELADAQNSLGAVLAETGQLDPAEQAFRAALRINPTLARAHANLANLLAGKSDLTQAIWHYERAGAGAPDQFNYGIALARLNRLADAETHIAAAVQADPNLAEARDVLGTLLENRSRIDEAIAQYRAAINIRPDFGKAHLDLGAALANRRDLAAASEEFRKALADPQVHDQAAQALKMIGR
jgi:tetratricopeptide (TPR) repeat protein